TNATALGQLSIARTSGGNDKLLYATWGGDGVLQLPPGSNIGDGFEHTIAIVYDGATTIQAYYDGVPGASATIPTLNTVNGQVMLGQTLYGAVSAGAEMRHFAIYPTALSGGAIEDIHTAIQTGGTSAYSQPANGSVTQVGDQLFYVPNEGFHGDDTFTYSITDGNGGEDSALVTVTVLGNQPPVANDDAVTTDQGQNITIDVLANDSDPEGDTLSFVPTVNAISTLNGMTPALYWACLPESGPTVTDQSGNGNDGTIQGNVVAGGIAGDCGGATPVFADGSALIFNGLPNTLPLGAAARTIVVRYRTSLSTPSDVGLYGYGTNASPLGQFSIARTAAGNDRLLFASWGGDNILHLAPGTNIADGAEHTIVITYDGANTVTGWVDGVAGTPATIPQLNTQNSVAMLGQTLYGAVSAGAEMRHFAIYNGVLTGTQIGEIHSAIEAGGATAWSQPANGVVTQAGNGLQYDPNVGFVGTDSFTYTIQDVDGHTASATVTVTVNAVT
ncbi:MAG: tandem-95 repeat protein, partial [Acidimicrobiales bacterium]|nr:tandem-95 repeat protein [Acidimicrobiales bacterium]